MIRSVKVTNHLGEELLIELENPNATGFLVAGINGLGPPKADINMTSIASYDGSVHNSSRVDSRNIVITLVYVGDDIEAQRHLSYKYFPIERNVTLEITTDRRIGKISGYIESNDVGIFSKMEGSQISVVCPDPWFEAVTDYENEHRFSNIISTFEFPFENDSLSSSMIEFSTISIISSGVIPYTGDLETGITMKIRCFGATGNITITNSDTREQMIVKSDIIQTISNGTALTAGDEIYITTYRGRKTARLFRNGRFINILSAIDKASNWFTLSTGNNNFAYRTASGGNAELSISGKVLYEGL